MLNWEQVASGAPEYVATYRGLTLRAIHDDSPSNPFEDGDSHWPMLVNVGRNDIQSYDAVGLTAMATTPLADPISRFSDEALVHDQLAIARILDINMQLRFERKYVHDANELRSVFEDRLGDYGVSARLVCYHKIYELLGIPSHVATSRGYSQGDYAELLIVATPEAQDKFGWKPGEERDFDLDAQAKLYGYWAWGDVYGYKITRPGDPYEEDLGSCWGFFGPDFEASGLENEAICEADYLLRCAEKRKQAKLKELIKRKVPIRCRPAILAKAGAVA